MDPLIGDLSFFKNDRIELFFKLFELLRRSSDCKNSTDTDSCVLALRRELALDDQITNLSLSEKTKVEGFFTSIIDQPAFGSSDYKRIRKFLIDWYSVQRILVTKAREAIDPAALTQEELNELILSFGFPYPNGIIGRKNKILFLYELIKLYKSKGSPSVFLKPLQLYFGLSNIVLSEWWIHRDLNGNYMARSVPLLDARGNPEFKLEKKYEDFIKGNPYWQLTEEQLHNYYIDPNTKISLPSITPVVSIQATIDLENYLSGISILHRKLKETWEFWVKNVLVKEKDAFGFVGRLSVPPTNSQLGDIYIIGKSPTGVWKDHENNLATWIGDSTSDSTTDTTSDSTTDTTSMFDSTNDTTTDTSSSSNGWYFTSPVNADRYILDPSKTTEFYQNKIAEYIGAINKWVYFTPKSNAIISVDDYDNHFLWNGEEWVNIQEKLPTSWLSTSNTSNLNRDISLNRFFDSYSFLEVMLAIHYLFNGNQDTTDEKYLQFSGTDSLRYPGTTVPFDGSVPKDDIDDVEDFSIIIDEYNDLTYDPTIIDERTRNINYRHKYTSLINLDNVTLREKYDPRYYRDANLKIRDNDFRNNIDRSNESYITTFEKTEANLSKALLYIKALNPQFYRDILDLEAVNKDSILESILLDFEDYLKNKLAIINIPLTHVILGTDVYGKLKDIINFFKPFRVKLLDFITAFSIKDPLGDSVITSDENYDLISSQIVDLPPWGLDNGCVKDYLHMSIPIIGWRDYVHKNDTFENMMKDIFTGQIKDSFNEYARIHDKTVRNDLGQMFVEIGPKGFEYGILSGDNCDISTVDSTIKSYITGNRTDDSLLNELGLDGASLFDFTFLSYKETYYSSLRNISDELIIEINEV